jgi:hypothetical protein
VKVCGQGYGGLEISMSMVKGNYREKKERKEE